MKLILSMILMFLVGTACWFLEINGFKEPRLYFFIGAASIACVSLILLL